MTEMPQCHVGWPGCGEAPEPMSIRAFQRNRTNGEYRDIYEDTYYRNWLM